MNDEQRFDRTARTWLEAGPTRAPDRAVDTALATITTTPQERDLRVPWRLPNVSIIPRVAVIAVLIAVVGGGALFLLRSPTSPGVGVQPSIAPTPSPSPSPMALDAYVAARNAICDRVGAETEPLRTSFGSFGTEITAPQRAAWIDALERFRDRYLVAVDEIAALVPPATLAEGHAQNVTDLRALEALIQDVADALREGRDADAQAADQATEPIADRSARWELEHVLHYCP